MLIGKLRVHAFERVAKFQSCSCRFDNIARMDVAGYGVRPDKQKLDPAVRFARRSNDVVYGMERGLEPYNAYTSVVAVSLDFGARKVECCRMTRLYRGEVHQMAKVVIE